MTTKPPELRATTARERHVLSAIDPDEWREGLTRPFVVGPWWVASDGRILVAYRSRPDDPTGSPPLRAATIPYMLEPDPDAEPLKTTVRALRAWAGDLGGDCGHCSKGVGLTGDTCAMCDGTGEADRACWAGRAGMLCGVPVNRRLLAYMLAEAPDENGPLEVFLSGFRSPSEDGEYLILVAETWRGVLMPLSMTVREEAERHVFPGGEDG